MHLIKTPDKVSSLSLFRHLSEFDDHLNTPSELDRPVCLLPAVASSMCAENLGASIVRTWPQHANPVSERSPRKPDVGRQRQRELCAGIAEVVENSVGYNALHAAVITPQRHPRGRLVISRRRTGAHPLGTTNSTSRSARLKICDGLGSTLGASLKVLRRHRRWYR